MKQTVISTTKAPAAIGPYSQGIEVGNWVFTSGQIPLTPEGNLAGPSIEEQVRQVLQNAEQILLAAGTSLDNVVKTTVFLADMNDFQIMNSIYAEFFTAEPPARSAVQVTRLPKDVKVEVEMIAFKN
ncbi:RidA family protein [Desulfitobacterium metallireducens]|uniref:Endoribonuclease L-PSP n=1 Tax=Desulfitobacterium metallireducens DSM 15288 TaxID=871968 RepID=W0EAZ8_9FIRM|nr:RidA family protein [Desulfitobacterium metallireducens]AHF06678.1 endoribonuclease L-PSP [Desulfitobacterium metallireducens DSM 15288]